MQIPLSFWDISIWLTTTAIILLITAELISPYYGQTNLLINKTRLEKATLTIGVLAFITIAIRVYQITAS